MDIAINSSASCGLSNGELLTTYNQLPIGIFIIDEREIIVEVNTYGLEIFNNTREEVLGKKFGDSIHCKNSILSIDGCGTGENCESCTIQRTIKATINEAEEKSNVENTKVIFKNGKEVEMSFRAIITPANINGKKYSIVSLVDITEGKARETKLLKEMNFCHSIFDNFPTIVWKINEESNCDYLNYTWERFTGKTIEEGLGNGWKSFVHPDDVKIIEEIVVLNIERRIPFEGEFRLFHTDGTYHWVLKVGRPIFDENNIYRGYIGTAYDITEKNLVEEELMRYKLLAENVRDIILFVDEDGHVIEANRAALKAYGYTREELIGLDILSIRDSTPQIAGNIPSSYKKGMRFESVNYRKNGTSFPVEVTMQGTVINGKNIRLNIIRDISERKKAEESLRDNQAKYYSFFHNMNDAFAYNKIIFDENNEPLDLEYIEVNNAYEKLFNRPWSTLVNKTLLETYPELGKICMYSIKKAYRENRRFKNLVSREIFVQPISKWLVASSFVPREGYVATFLTDVTDKRNVDLEIRNAKEAAEAANKAKSEFLANMSHEIRTPINGIMGMIDLTLLTKLNSTQIDNLNTAKLCANSLLKIINDILDFSKMEAGKLTLEEIDFNFREIIDGIMKAHNLSARKKGLEFDCIYPEDMPKYTRGDPNRLQQILNNLLNNAIKFTEVGRVRLNIKKIQEKDDFLYLRFDVSDTGIGIDHNNINKLFTTFSQVDSSITRKYGGTGLGLVISKQLAEMMGGSMWVESELGKGSTFYFIIKVKKGEMPKESLRQTKYVIKNDKPLKVLLAEDDIVNQVVVSRMLEEKGHTVDIAKNGLKAIDFYRKNKYDIILMDIQMPDLDGIETTKRIRELEGKGKHVPIIALTAHALKGDRDRFLSKGMDEYLAKPVSMENLFFTIDRVLSSMENKLSYSEEVTINEEGEIVFVKKKEAEAYPDKEVIEMLSTTIRKLDKAVLTKDFIEIEGVAHRVKELSNSITADSIKNIAFKIELSARKEDYKEIISLATRLEKEFEIFKNILG